MAGPSPEPQDGRVGGAQGRGTRSPRRSRRWLPIPTAFAPRCCGRSRRWRHPDRCRRMVQRGVELVKRGLDDRADRTLGSLVPTIPRRRASIARWAVEKTQTILERATSTFVAQLDVHRVVVETHRRPGYRTGGRVASGNHPPSPEVDQRLRRFARRPHRWFSDRPASDRSGIGCADRSRDAHGLGSTVHVKSFPGRHTLLMEDSHASKRSTIVPSSPRLPFSWMPVNAFAPRVAPWSP